MTEPRSAPGFSARVAILLATSLIGAGLGVINGILLARMVGPTGKGDYYLSVLLPATIVVLLQLGLPQSFNYFAAQGRTRGIVVLAVVLGLVLAAIGFAGSLALMPWLRETFIRGPEPEEILIGLLVLPLSLTSTFTNGIVVGRQAVRWNLVATIGSSIVSLALLVFLAGVLGLGVIGALFAFLIANAVQYAIYLAGSRAVTRQIREPALAKVRELFRFGIPLYPGTLTTFFSNRLDVLLIAWLMVDASTALGYYSMAVTMAEMTFFFPGAVSRLFFPHVAGSERSVADLQAPLVSRVTLMITVLSALLVVPASILLIRLVLPAFEASLPVLFVLLPGVVMLSVGNVARGYIVGLGRTAAASSISIAAFLVNLALNLELIPAYGIIGAAVASLVSYSLGSIAYTGVASRMSGARFHRFWVPGVDDARLAWSQINALRRWAVRRPSGGA